MPFFSTNCCPTNALTCNVDLEALQTVICDAITECTPSTGGSASYTTGYKEEFRLEGILNNFVLPQGAYDIEIFNVDGVKQMFVNGRPVGARMSYVSRHEINEVDKRQDFVPAVTFTNPNGAYTSVFVSFPEGSNIDFASLITAPP